MLTFYHTLISSSLDLEATVSRDFFVPFYRIAFLPSYFIYQIWDWIVVCCRHYRPSKAIQVQRFYLPPIYPTLLHWIQIRVRHTLRISCWRFQRNHILLRHNSIWVCWFDTASAFLDGSHLRRQFHLYFLTIRSRFLFHFNQFFWPENFLFFHPFQSILGWINSYRSHTSPCKRRFRFRKLIEMK